MRTTTTYINEFTGEVFTDKGKCEQAEKESKKYFVVELMGQMDIIKDICNNTCECADCPFSFLEKEGEDIECLVTPFIDDYLGIVSNLHKMTRTKN